MDQKSLFELGKHTHQNAWVTAMSLSPIMMTYLFTPSQIKNKISIDRSLVTHISERNDYQRLKVYRYNNYIERKLRRCLES